MLSGIPSRSQKFAEGYCNSRPSCQPVRPSWPRHTNAGSQEIWLMRFGEAQLFSYGKSHACHGEAALVTIATKAFASFGRHILGVRLNGFTGVEVYKLNIIIILRVSFDCSKGPNLPPRLPLSDDAVLFLDTDLVSRTCAPTDEIAPSQHCVLCTMFIPY